MFPLLRNKNQIAKASFSPEMNRWLTEDPMPEELSVRRMILRPKETESDRIFVLPERTAKYEQVFIDGGSGKILWIDRFLLHWDGRIEYARLTGLKSEGDQRIETARIKRVRAKRVMRLFERLDHCIRNADDDILQYVDDTFATLILTDENGVEWIIPRGLHAGGESIGKIVGDFVNFPVP